MARQLDEKRNGRERYIDGVKTTLRGELAVHGINAEISGRPKHIYSIWRKMQKKQVSMEELYDLRAVRVAVDDVAACYAALGVVHALWLPIPSEFDDYIARPKPNDYRSLHTAVTVSYTHLDVYKRQALLPSRPMNRAPLTAPRQDFVVMKFSSAASAVSITPKKAK